MITFFIFYFVFSAMFMLGNEGYKEDNIPVKQFITLILAGWIVMPFGLGMLFAKIMNDDLTINKDE